jgi:phosphatidylglycerophosphate synthase
MSTATHVRQHNSILAAAEKRALIWMATRLPRWVNSDHLSGLGLASMAGAGLAFVLAASDPVAGVSLVVLCLLLNWFGDSLDGTLARVRDQQRPRYGYYVDHVIDLAGTAMLFAGIAASGYMSPAIAALVVAAYFMVSAETYLATHSRGVFKMAFLGVGPTELRILLAAGALALVNTPMVSPFGFGPVALWDLGGVIGAIGMVGAFIVSSARNTRALYLEETNRS